MKRTFAFILFIILLSTFGFAIANDYDASSSATTTSESDYSSGGIMKVLGKERVFTRSGPATGFRDTGTYTVKDGSIRAYSYAYDKSDQCWVQCDFTYNNKLRRLYTRLEDIDEDCFDCDGLPEEEPLGYKAKVNSVTKLLYGPGTEYDTYGNSFKSTKGATVYITAIEGDYAQVEWTTSKQSYRVWVPLHILDY